MSLLLRVVFASACRNTHHKLAIDALRQLRHPSHELWRNLFLKHFESYLLGSKVPDDQFKDFKNHVLHVRENYWGGAVTTSRLWFDRLVMALRSQQWRDAVFAAGVLSHYVTDPHMPLHTAQSEHEGSVHRPLEWSIACSYDELKSLLEKSLGGYPELVVSTQTDWLEDLIRKGADFANTHYESAIDHYDVGRGVKNPLAGLDLELKQRMAQCLGRAVVAWARVLDRSFELARVAPPAVELTMETAGALLKIPVRYALRMVENEQERAVVQKIYREFQEQGKVVERLPEDEKMVRRLHAQQVLKVPLTEHDARKARTPGSKHGQPVSRMGTSLTSLSAVTSSERPGQRWVRPAKKKSAAPVAEVKLFDAHERIRVPRERPPATLDERPAPAPPGTHSPLDSAEESAGNSWTSRTARLLGSWKLPAWKPFWRRANPDSASAAEPAEATVEPVSESARARRRRERANRKLQSASEQESPAAEIDTDRRAVAEPEATSHPPDLAREETRTVTPDDFKSDNEPESDPRRESSAARSPVPRFYHDEDRPRVDAPSIGPKTAKRFESINVNTIADFLKLSPESVAQRLGVKSFDAETLRSWQTQTRLACRVPGLRGHDVQILVACGISDPEELAGLDPQELHELIEPFLDSPEADRILRGAKPPDRDEVSDWIHWASHARSLRAA